MGTHTPGHRPHVELRCSRGAFGVVGVEVERLRAREGSRVSQGEQLLPLDERRRCVDQNSDGKENHGDQTDPEDEHAAAVVARAIHDEAPGLLR